MCLPYLKISDPLPETYLFFYLADFFIFFTKICVLTLPKIFRLLTRNILGFYLALVRNSSRPGGDISKDYQLPITSCIRMALIEFFLLELLTPCALAHVTIVIFDTAGIFADDFCHMRILQIKLYNPLANLKLINFIAFSFINS